MGVLTPPTKLFRSCPTFVVNHGGEVKELADSDIAFVTGKTSSAESRCGGKQYEFLREN
jgi:hypothetical protein